MKKIDEFILKYATFIDDVDMFIGPFQVAASNSGSEAMNDLNYLVQFAHYGVLKAPFIGIYIARTRNFSALLNWVPREVFSFAAPLGGFIEVLRNYERTVKTYYEEKGAKKES